MTDEPRDESDDVTDDVVDVESDDVTDEVVDVESDDVTDEVVDVESDDVTDEVADSSAPADTKRKVLMLGGMVLVLLALGGLYLLWARGRVSSDLADRTERAQQAVGEFEASQRADEPAAELAAQPAATPTPVPRETAPPLAPGEILVINRVPGDDYGSLAIRHTDGSRTLVDRDCMRVHISAKNGVCLSEAEGLVASFRTTFFPAENITADLESYSSALPSRARVSPGGTFSAVSAFISGSSYADIGVGETAAFVTVDEIEGEGLRTGSQFVVVSDDDRYDNFDAQYWGITFAADEDEIYVTGFYEDAPEIMHGTLGEMTLEPTGWVGSCPSLSPDGETLVFKEMRTDGGFDLVAVDLASGTKWALGETRSVDDQVEWLDDDTILYAIHPEDGDQALQPEFDIWMLDIAEGSEPELFLPNADSPAVPR